MDKTNARKITAFLTALCLLSVLFFSGTVSAVKGEDLPVHTVTLYLPDGSLLSMLLVEHGTTLQKAKAQDPGSLTPPWIEGFIFQYWLLGGQCFSLNEPVTRSLNLTAFYKEVEKPVAAEPPAVEQPAEEPEQPAQVKGE